MSDSRKEQARAIEASIEIEARAEDVWNALTRAEELTRWFPLDATVTPGEGGSISISWRGAWASDNRIEIWEPNRRLRTVLTQAPYDADGTAQASPAPRELAVDYQIESSGGKTTLRLVHSGFGADASWDDEVEGVGRGWQYELRSLRHYLERHRGEDRVAAWTPLTISGPLETAWATLAGPAGMIAEGSIDGLRDGEAYSIATPWGDRLAGTVVRSNAPHELAGTVDNWNDGLFRLQIDQVGDRLGVIVWLATYGVDSGRVREFESRSAARLAEIFAAQTVAPRSQP